jgi:hypothetical protein
MLFLGGKGGGGLEGFFYSLSGKKKKNIKKE